MRKTWSVVAAFVMAATVVGCGSDSNQPTDPTLSRGQSNVRVAHLSPDAPNVDVWVNDAIVLMDVPFGAVSDYLVVPAGQHRFRVTPAGQNTPVVIERTETVVSGMSYTIAAVDYLASIDSVVMADDRIAGSEVKVRFVHTSPDAPAVDVGLTGGGNLFSNVSFGDVEDYITVAGASYDLEVRLAGTDAVALPLPGVIFTNGTNVTIFAVGEAGNGTLAPLVALDTP